MSSRRRQTGTAIAVYGGDEAPLSLLRRDTCSRQHKQARPWSLDEKRNW